MSEEISYRQVKRVRQMKASHAETVGPILKELMNRAPVQVVSNMQMIQVKNNIVSQTTPTILSPTSLSFLQERFNQNLIALNKTQISNGATKLKAAALLTMQQEQENLKIESRAPVVSAIQELITATTLEQTTVKVKSAFAEIKKEHTRVFVSRVGAVIQMASSKVGFSKQKVEILSPNLTRVVATNSKGHNLISEIHTNAEKKVDIQSELEGITDGSCKKIMDEFNKELESLGLSADRKERKPTGGIAQMPYAKTLQKQRSGGSIKREFKNEQVIISKDNKNVLVQYT